VIGRDDGCSVLRRERELEELGLFLLGGYNSHCISL